jgi:hypothetical protein
MKLKRSEDFGIINEKEKKPSHPGIGDLSGKKQKQMNDRRELELLKKKFELKKEDREDAEKHKKKKGEEKEGKEGIIKKAVDFAKDQLTKKYEPAGRYY